MEILDRDHSPWKRKGHASAFVSIFFFFFVILISVTFVSFFFHILTQIQENININNRQQFGIKLVLK